jgi:hypothetical protein
MLCIYAPPNLIQPEIRKHLLFEADTVGSECFATDAQQVLETHANNADH